MSRFTVEPERAAFNLVRPRFRVSPWRDLPDRHGPYTTVYNRYNRWAKAGVRLRIFEALAARSSQSMQLLDSSIIRAHQHAAGAKKGVRITPSAVLVSD